MISFDLECSKGHRFEGIFKDYESFNSQLEGNRINCPLCECSNIKRLFSGCSIQTRSQSNNETNKEMPDVFQLAKRLEVYIRENFEYVGNEFPDAARAIYYGIEEERNIYGESSPDEVKELLEEGIDVLPIPKISKFEN